MEPQDLLSPEVRQCDSNLKHALHQIYTLSHSCGPLLFATQYRLTYSQQIWCLFRPSAVAFHEMRCNANIPCCCFRSLNSFRLDAIHIIKHLHKQMVENNSYQEFPSSTYDNTVAILFTVNNAASQENQINTGLPLSSEDFRFNQKIQRIK